MGLLSSSQSVSRYRVEGDMGDSVLDHVRNGLKANAISQIEDEYAEIATGWTPYESPFDPDFDIHPFVFGTFFLFCLRIDKKSIPSKVVQKHTTIEIARKLKETGREFLSKNEKTDIKDAVIEKLMRQIPSVPNIYDVLWKPEESSVTFFSTQKAANEELETLFTKSFKLKLIRLFPFTMAENNPDFSTADRDKIAQLSPVKFSRE
ncbi:MAG: recombination-associated protein RdgC [Pseudomonadota bacterium]